MISRTALYLTAWLLIGSVSSEAGEKAGERRLFSPDGSRLVVTAERAKLKVLGSNGAILSEIPLPSPAAEIAFSPNGSQLAICLDGGGLVTADTASGVQKKLKADGVCSNLSWSRDGGRLDFVLTRFNPSKRTPEKSHEVRIIETGTGDEKLLHSAKLKIPVPSAAAEHPVVIRPPGPAPTSPRAIQAVIPPPLPRAVQPPDDSSSTRRGGLKN